ncbi:N-acetylgalactosamine kinase-like [Lineus longissimus]|uniref:N-acetylgalactosamine kinase-like n=1 Tax=Lineus longissimus TaxID=88925 RepID=UPI002B4D09A8
MVDVQPPVVAVPLSQKDRYAKLKELFEQKYGTAPDFYARAPGRVNLIGEHIDYCGYGVLPMALEQDIVIAVSPNNDGVIRLANSDGNFEDFTCEVNDFEIDKSRPLWYHYFLCGLKGIIEHFKLENPQGMNLVLDGNVPRSAGLSSSSALVCASSLAAVYANGKQLSKLEIADVCSLCEHYIGTIGGGMDQAISFLGQPGTAKYIEFNPLKAKDVALPDGVVFVVSNSCVELNKAATSDFNTRVVECRLAAQILAKKKGLYWRGFKKLGSVQNALGLKLDGMLQEVRQHLHEEPYTKDEVCLELGVTADELASTSLSENTLHVQSFKLFQRATHVYGEANRVLKFKEICTKKPEGATVTLGDLMSESHASCRDMYECSCADLDALVDICIKSGSLGSRLTGAGWGGCAVSMVPADQVEQFIASLSENYYSNDAERAAKVDTALFATQPGGGAAIYYDY